MNRTAYRASEKSLHWMSAAAIITLIGIAIWGGQLSPGPTKLILGRLHLGLGVIVLALSMVRAAIRLSGPKLSGIGIAARSVHTGLYLLLFAIPATGLVTTIRSNGINILLNLSGGEAYNPLLAEDTANLHIILAYTMVIALIGHIGAAFWHQFVLRDGTMAKMMR